MVERWRAFWRRWRVRPKKAAPSRATGGAVTARHIAGRTVSYAPDLNGRADPGEVVWVEVIHEDEPFQGKDRPVLVVGRRDERTVLALMLSSQAHRAGQRHWHPLGSGAWDAQQRPSWVRLDRVLELHDRGLRREGAVMDRRAFEQLAERLRTDYGWR